MRCPWMAAVVAVAVVAGTTGCSSAPIRPAGGGRISVVAAENVWGDIASQIGGSHVSVISIISDPNTDPHTFSSNPEDAAEITTSQLVIENGLGYDDFMDKILATSPSAKRRVLSVQQVLNVEGSDANPHLWYWTARLPQVAAAIAKQLSAIDPADARTFHQNARRFDTSLRPLLATIATIKRRYGGDPIAYTERVPGYLVQAAGLRLGTPIGFSLAIEDGNAPSPQDTEAFDADITNRRVKVLLYNSQVVDAQTAQVKQLALTAHVPLVGVSETLPPSYPTFQAWQLAQDRELLKALGS